jgi:hypothetical protein
MGSMFSSLTNQSFNPENNSCFDGKQKMFQLQVDHSIIYHLYIGWSAWDRKEVEIITPG